jgi:leucyl aminopeptidase (aminopeptidase T)
MTTKDKSVAILKRIRDITSSGGKITFTGDFESDLTVEVNDNHFHTYNGKTKSDDELINELYSNLKHPIQDY